MTSEVIAVPIARADHEGQKGVDPMNLLIRIAPMVVLMLTAAGPIMAAPSEPSAVVDRFFAAYRAADVNGMLEIYAPDAVFFDVSQRHRVEGREELRKFLTRLVGLHNQMDVVIQRRIAAGDQVVVEYTYQGMLSGEALHTATGNPGCRDTSYTIPVTSWFEVRDGRIIRQTDYIDLQTLGEVKARASGKSAATSQTKP